MTATDDQPSRLEAARHPPMRRLLGTLADNSAALLAALLLANSLRLHFPGWAADLLFGLVTALLGMALFREGGIFGATPPGRPQRPLGASRLLFTSFCFAALLALYGTGLVFDFSGQGLRNLAGLVCIAAVFLFCCQNGAKLAQSRSAVPLFLLGALAFLPLYWSPADAHPVLLAVYLGYALLCIGILLAARSRSRTAQHLWAHAALLAAALVALAFGSRALMLAMLLALPFYWGAQRLLRSRGGALALAGVALALAGGASTVLSSSRLQETLLNLSDLGWSYTGGALESGRHMLFRASLSGILDAPWFGSGPAADVTKLAPIGNSPFSPEEPYCLLWANAELLNDCKALLQARGALVGSNKARLWSWDFDRPITQWSGVELGGSPLRVLGLDLAQQYLAGQIPPALGELQQLSSLRLGQNHLSGPIPAELGKLRNLSVLSLSHNFLTGAIPQELGRLANLEELHLNHNRLSGEIPGSLATLDRLRSISLNGNNFAGFPPVKLYSLQHDFYNGLLCLPPLWENPSLLQECTVLLEVRDILAGNGTPLNWRHSLPMHQWRGVEFGGHEARVVALRLPNTGLAGRIPAQLHTLRQLAELHLENNQLKGRIPPELGRMRMRNLRVLRLSGNKFNAPMPPELWEIPDHDLGEDLYCAPGPRISPGLLKDCTTLLAVQGILAGKGALNWRQSAPIGRWHGVGVGGDPVRVVRLHLSDNGLSGRIPAELGRLDQLVQLHLHNNELTGPVPAQLGRLQNLESLLLDNNDFANPVPGALREVADRNRHGNWFCPRSAPAAPGLVADCNLLLAVRDTLAGNSALNWRRDRPIGDWQGVGLAGSPARVEFLALTKLPDSGRIPPELGRLAMLRELILLNNNLVGTIPPQLGNLKNLRALHLHHNKLTGAIPPELGALDLEELRLENNNLVGAIPPQLGNLKNLRVLHLQHNGLTGAIPPQLGNLKNLRMLRLNSNRLTGAVPPAVAALDLELLRLQNNRWLRKTPAPAGRRRQPENPRTGERVLAASPLATPQADQGDAGPGPLCQGLSESNRGLQADCGLLLAVRDRLAGSVKLNWAPTTPLRFWQGVTLGGAPLRVTALDLSRRGIDGLIPPELGGLEQLVSLRLHRNALTGAIPATLGQLAHLRELLLSGNFLRGPIPRQLGLLSRLTALHLRRNRLQGTIPTELGELSSLRTLALDDNDLTGPIPAQLGDLLDLEELLLGNNRLSGTAPAKVLAPPKLSALWLDAPPPGPALEERRLVDEGETPTAAGLFCYPELDANPPQDCAILLGLRDVLAGDADLNWRPSVPIQAWQGVMAEGNPPRIKAILLSHANLSGRIPNRLNRLKQLRSLHLEGNQLTGPIPASLNLEHLHTLALDGNQLTGPLPQSLLNLAGLNRLGLGDNRLSGSVTNMLEKMKQRRPSWNLNLGGNDFSGCLPPRLHGLADRRLELDLRCDPSPWGKPRLFEDAAVLMGMRDLLAGEAELNWRYDRPLSSWRGVSIGGKPMRVVALDLSRMGLNGRIPPQLGALDALVDLRLGGNRLTGAIPPELGRLTDLRTLRLDGNAATGAIPQELENLHQLEDLRLDGNRLASCQDDANYPIYRFLPIEQFPLCRRWTDEIETIGRYIYRLNDLINPTAQSRLAESSHNLFLHIGLQSGLLGLGAAALLCLSLIFNLRRQGDKEVTPVQCLTAAGAFTAVFYSAFEIFLLQHFLSAAVFAWAAIGIGTGLARANCGPAEAGDAGEDPQGAA